MKGITSSSEHANGRSSAIDFGLNAEADIPTVDATVDARRHHFSTLLSRSHRMAPQCASVMNSCFVSAPRAFDAPKTKSHRARGRLAVVASASADRVAKIRASSLQLDAYDDEAIARGVIAMRARESEVFASSPDWLLAWFLRDRKLDVDKAADKTKKYLQWRSEDGYENLSRSQEVEEEALSGKAVLLNERDVLGRPVVYVTLTKHDVETRELARTCKLCVKLVDEALETLRNEGPGASETLMCVFDLRGFSMKNADIDFVKFFIKCIFDYFPKRISQVLLIEPPWVFTPVWQIIKPLMGKYASLVKQTKAKEAKEYFADESALF